MFRDLRCPIYQSRCGSQSVGWWVVMVSLCPNVGWMGRRMVLESFLRGTLVASEVGEVGARNVVVVVTGSVYGVVRRGVDQEEEGPHGSG